MPAFTDLPSREKEAKLRELAQQTLGIRIFNKAQQLQSACVCACASAWLRASQQLVASEACLTAETAMVQQHSTVALAVLRQDIGKGKSLLANGPSAVRHSVIAEREAQRR